MGASETYNIVRTCCRQCHCECGVLVHVKGNEIIRIEGDPSDVVTGGVICCKALAAKQLVYHPNRIKYPIKRMGERGEGKWKRISWDEALESIATRLKEIKRRYGPEAVIFLRGTARGPWTRMFNRLANAFGSPNWCGPGIAQCFFPRVSAQIMTFGGPALECPDYESTRCMLVWASNPVATWPAKAAKLMSAKFKGAKLIVVDPKFTETASKADLWLQIRPGTDCALALGMLNIIINDELYDKDFVENWCTGFDKLKERVQEYPPGKVAEITWIEESKIKEAAITYATTKPASITQCVAIDQNIDPIQTSRAISILAAITGNIDIPGGNIFPMTTGHLNVQFSREFVLQDNLPVEKNRKRLGFEKYKFLSGDACLLIPSAHAPTVWRTILTEKPYPIRAAFIMGTNPVVSYANSREVIEALKKLEFIAVADFFITATGEFADIILPSATWLERSDLVDSYQSTYGPVRLRQKVISVGECKSDIEILIELGKRLGLKEYFPWANEIEFINYLLQPLGITIDELKRRGYLDVRIKYRKYTRTGFRTPSGKVELYSSILAKEGFDPLPRYKENPESPLSKPEVAKEYPYILTTGRRSIAYFHSELRNVPWLHEIEPDAEADIHPDIAASTGIKDGDYIWIETPHGKVKVKANITKKTNPKVINVSSHWEGDANINLAVNNKECAEGMGTTPLRGLLCKVRKAFI